MQQRLTRPDPSRGQPTGAEEITNIAACVLSLGLYDLETKRAERATAARQLAQAQRERE